MHAVCFQGGNHWVQISFSLINCYKKANILILVKWDLLWMVSPASAFDLKGFGIQLDRPSQIGLC